MILPARKPTGLQGYNYRENGAYFITICTEKRTNILWSAVGEGSPLPNLSGWGEIAESFIKQIPVRYENITVDKYVVMLNHIHLLLMVHSAGRGNPSPTITQIVGWFKYQTTKRINETAGTAGMRRFQRSFYDHIVRNEEDYKQIWQYIEDNPRKWEQDCFCDTE